MKTVPTGFTLVPPSGPAMPVTPTPTSTPAFLRAPAAICAAIASLTAPCASIALASTPSSSILAAFEYVTKPRSK